MASEKLDSESLERRLRRLEGLFLVMFANDSDWSDDDLLLRDVMARLAHFPDPPFFEELLHRLVRRGPGGGRVARLEQKFSKLEAAVHDNQLSLHQYLSLALLGAGTDDVPMKRLVPVRVYLKKDEARVRDEVAEAVTAFAASLGLVVSDDLPAEEGSWFKRWFTKTGEALRQPEMQERLAKGERALELQALHKPQAAVDKDQAEAAAALITAIAKEDDAILQVGSILIVKSKGVLVTRTLTQKELIHVERHPELLKLPGEILSALSGCERDAPQLVPSLPPKAG